MLEELVIQLIEQLENKGILDNDIYNLLVEKYPNIKSILDDMIYDIKIYSIYDVDKDKINFDYSLYLQNIKKELKWQES